LLDENVKPLEKREKFAESLRKKKREETFAAKRRKIECDPEIKGLTSYYCGFPEFERNQAPFIAMKQFDQF